MENSTEVEWQAWGKGPLPLPDLPIEELPGWDVCNSQEPLHIKDWSKDERFPRLKKLGTELGMAPESIGSIVRVPLTTPTRRSGTLVSAAPQALGIARKTSDFCSWSRVSLPTRLMTALISGGRSSKPGDMKP